MHLITKLLMDKSAVVLFLLPLFYSCRLEVVQKNTFGQKRGRNCNLTCVPKKIRAPIRCTFALASSEKCWKSETMLRLRSSQWTFAYVSNILTRIKVNYSTKFWFLLFSDLLFQFSISERNFPIREWILQLTKQWKSWLRVSKR